MTTTTTPRIWLAMLAAAGLAAGTALAALTTPADPSPLARQATPTVAAGAPAAGARDDCADRQPIAGGDAAAVGKRAEVAYCADDRLFRHRP